jgi:hypothetical protein
MTPEARKTLLGLIIEYGNSLTRIQGEKDLLKMIEQRAVVECAAAAKAFKTIATAHWADTTAKVRDDLEAQLDLLDTVRAVDEAAAEGFPDAA